MKKTLIFLLLAINFSGMSQNSFRYVALGDSYTICTGATTETSWPVILCQHLKEKNIKVDLIANPSHNGWTTQNLIDRELPVFESSKPTFATLLIGVNDWVQGVPVETFKKNLIYILDKVQSTLPDKSKLILITIPDFGVTPTGAHYSNGRNISEGIAEFNKLIVQQATTRNLKAVDLFP